MASSQLFPNYLKSSVNIKQHDILMHPYTTSVVLVNKVSLRMGYTSIVFADRRRLIYYNKNSSSPVEVLSSGFDLRRNKSSRNKATFENLSCRFSSAFYLFA